MFTYIYIGIYTYIGIFIHTHTHTHTHTATATYGNAMQHPAITCNTLSHTATGKLAMSTRLALDKFFPPATHCNTRQNTATHCNTLHLRSTPCQKLGPRRNTPQIFFFLQRTATQGNTLQHTATEKRTYPKIWATTQHTAHIKMQNTHTETHGNTLQHPGRTLQHTATHRSTPHCNTLQHALEKHTLPKFSATAYMPKATPATPCGTCVLRCVAVCCGVLQGVVVHCSVL